MRRRLHRQGRHRRKTIFPLPSKTMECISKNNYVFLFMAALKCLGIRIFTVYLRLGEGRVESFPGGYLILQKALAGSQVVCSNILLPRCYSFPHVSIHKPFEKSSKVNINWRWNSMDILLWGKTACT